MSGHVGGGGGAGGDGVEDTGQVTTRASIAAMLVPAAPVACVGAAGVSADAAQYPWAVEADGRAHNGEKKQRDSNRKQKFEMHSRNGLQHKL